MSHVQLVTYNKDNKKYKTWERRGYVARRNWDIWV